MSQPSNKTWVNFQSILSFIRCLRVESWLMFVFELTLVLFESWRMFCLWVNSCFAWELTRILFVSWLMFCLKIESCFAWEGHLSNKTWVKSLTKHESTLKQNMSQLSSKTWVNSQTKHESTLKQNMS
jgi:hypothetical protein